MKQRLGICFVLVLLLCGCASPRETTSGYTFTDDLGREVTVTSWDRTAALMGSFADVWYLAGGQVCAAAEDAWEDFSLDLPEETVNLGRLHGPSQDALLAADPDFVIASSKIAAHLELEETLENCGIAVAYFDIADFQSYLRLLKICTDLTGCQEAYETYGTAQELRIREILEGSEDREAPRVLVLRASAASIRVKNSDGTMLGGMLRDFGCENIADSDASLLENLSVEAIALEDPDRIFFVQTGDDLQSVRENVEALFRDNPLWTQLTAVQTGRVHIMEKELYNLKPNARFAEAYENLARILYGNEGE